MNKYSVIFLAWGDKFIEEVVSCISKSSKFLKDYDLILITDFDTNITKVEPLVKTVVRAEFENEGLLRKTELHKHIPSGYESYMFLDSDTIILNDISLGFVKANIHGIAVCPAPHYSLDAFWGFDEVMEKESVLRSGQLQYNTGVIFFNNSQIVKDVFSRWGYLGNLYSYFKNDQPFFTLAMEELFFNPYTLSISYNYRGFGDAISGDVRVWHSHEEMPKNINKYDSSWPPRRAWPNRVESPSDNEQKRSNIFFKFINKFK